MASAVHPRFLGHRHVGVGTIISVHAREQIEQARVLGELALDVAPARCHQELVEAVGRVLQREMALSRLELTLPPAAGGESWRLLSWTADGPHDRPSEAPAAFRSDAPTLSRRGGQWGVTVAVPVEQGPAGSLTLRFAGHDVPRLAGEAAMVKAVGCMVGMACHRCGLPMPTPERRTARSAKTLDDAIRDAIGAALRASRGKIYGDGGAAQVLGLKPSTLQAKMVKLGIERARFV